MPINFQILTIFPELFEPFKKFGLISRAINENKIKIETTQLRDFAINTHGQIDDTPYGGGSGMILRIEPAVTAIKYAKKKLPNAKIVLFSPRGKTFNQELVKKLELTQASKEQNTDFIILCTRYEGVDERIIQHYVDLEISLGDYILMGGEVPAMAFMESICRLLPGVLGNPESIKNESFENYLLEYPQYTKPNVYEGLSVPTVLLSGNHQEIQNWQKEQALKITQERRPDLYQKAIHSKQLVPKVNNPNISLALIHYPVLGKNGEIITSSITNIDLHDVARSCKTFDVDALYIVHPTKILRRLSEKIFEHWNTGYGSTYNPNRKEALALLKILPTIEDVILDLRNRNGKTPIIVTTSARSGSDTISYENLREIIAETDHPFLILFGTGWGLANEVMELAKYRLDPILGCGRYNHLSVRSAAAIILDRLLG
ncbi:MAG: tRNA (guanosine(37)-N1)-methyltransferase TrmD [Deltaproteobacteria bacterium]|jgi:tRNA (guanine37-N1)-methyltransferase|nr:tRNA (guanosine(37)-N1)-methyltransferase TrmD [Deltaproteobacteria bacterium]